MKKNTCCFTSANYAYLSRARVLAATCKKYNPDLDIYLILNDVKPKDYEMNMEEEPFDYILQIDALDIPDFLNWSFKHNVVELCTAVKASAAKYLQRIYSKVIYLDPDIAVFNSLSTIVNQLDVSDILLTPHQLSACPNMDTQIKDIELCSLRHGTFNLGFFAVSDREQGKAFVEWWESRLLRYCYEDIPNGIFTDQKWCDMAPCYFSNLLIIRDCGCNVASWNLFERDISYIDNTLYVNQMHTLKFYHFTKYGSAGDVMTRRYAKSALIFEIWYWYGRFLKNYRYNLPPKDYWFYGKYYNGESITQEERIKHRKILNKNDRLDPYAVKAKKL